MLQQLLNTYTTRTQHNSTAKCNYYKFNANAAYVKHSIALQLLQQYYNTCTCFNTRFAINAAIIACNSKIAYAQKHVNFCVRTATLALQQHKRAQRNAARAAAK